jgi:hypothetical protein
MYCHMPPIVLKQNIMVGDLFTNIYGAITKSFLYYELFNWHIEEGNTSSSWKSTFITSVHPWPINYLLIWLYLTIYSAEFKVLYVPKSWRQKSVLCLYHVFICFVWSSSQKYYFSKHSYHIGLCNGQAVCQMCVRKWNLYGVCFWRDCPVGQGLLIHEISRSHTTTHHSL